ncbi:MAG TPA: hypothetical protein VGR87_06065 [Candidatus Limnocylindria bacterium]|jgi:hypothetical protein|nr:hypothetical protein [Candidatus Limnocylindria bacterium]
MPESVNKRLKRLEQRMAQLAPRVESKATVMHVDAEQFQRAIAIRDARFKSTRPQVQPPEDTPELPETPEQPTIQNKGDAYAERVARQREQDAAYQAEFDASVSDAQRMRNLRDLSIAEETRRKLIW